MNPPKRVRPASASISHRRLNLPKRELTRPQTAVKRARPVFKCRPFREKFPEEEVVSRECEILRAKHEIQSQMKQVRARSARRVRPTITTIRQHVDTPATNQLQSMREKFEKHAKYLNSIRQGTLHITIHNCKNLKAVDETSNASDPYVKVFPKNLGGQICPSMRQTNCRFKQLSPQFEEVLSFRVYSWKTTGSLRFCVFDEDGGDESGNELLGEYMYTSLILPMTYTNGTAQSPRMEVSLGAGNGSLCFSYAYSPDKNPMAANAEERMKNTSYIPVNSHLHNLPTDAKTEIGKWLDHLSKRNNTLDFTAEKLLPVLEKIMSTPKSKHSFRDDVFFSSQDVQHLLRLMTGRTEEDVKTMVRVLDVNCDEEINLSETVEFFLEDSRRIVNSQIKSSFALKAKCSTRVSDSIYSKIEIATPLGRNSRVPSGVVTSSLDGIVRVWNAKLDLAFTCNLNEDENEKHYAAKSFAGAGKILASGLVEDTAHSQIIAGCSDRQLRVFDLPRSFGHTASLKCKDRIKCKSVPLSLEMKREMLFCGDSDGNVSIFRQRREEDHPRLEFATMCQAHSSAVRQVKYVPFLDSVVSSGLDGKLIMLPLDLRHHKQTIVTNKRGIVAFDYSMATHTMAMVGFDMKIEIIDPLVKSRIGLLGNLVGNHGHREDIVSLSINDNKYQILTASRDKVVKVWDVRNHKLIQTISDDEQIGTLNVICANEEGVVFTGGSGIHSWTSTHFDPENFHADDTTFFDTEDEPSTKPFSNQETYIVATSNGIIVACNSSGHVSVFDAIKRNLVNQFDLKVNTKQCTGLALNFNERSFFVSFDNGSLVQYNLSSGWIIQEFEACKKDLLAVACFKIRNSEFTLGIVDGGQIICWKNSTGKISRIFENPSSRKDYQSMCKCGDNYLATGSADGHISIWHLGTGRPRFHVKIAHSNNACHTETEVHDGECNIYRQYLKRDQTIDAIVYIKEIDYILCGTSRGNVVALSVKSGKLTGDGKSRVCSHKAAVITAMVHNEIFDKKGKVVQPVSILFLADTNGRMRIHKFKSSALVRFDTPLDFGRPFRSWKDCEINESVHVIAHLPNHHLFAVPADNASVVLYNYVGQKVCGLNGKPLERFVVLPLSCARPEKEMFESEVDEEAREMEKSVSVSFGKLALDKLKTRAGNLLIDVLR